MRAMSLATTNRSGQLWWPVLLLLVAACAWAEPREEASTPAAEGLLFELIAPGGGPPSWLFGTIHSEDPRVLRLPDAVATALAAADTLVLEVVPDAASVRIAAGAMRLPAGTELRDLLPPETYRRCVEALAARGQPETVLRKLKPWAVMTLLSMPPVRTGDFLDRQLHQVAAAAGKATIGLETTAEQLAVFEQLTPTEQRALLRAALAAQGERERLFEALIDAYLRGALGELLALSDEHASGLTPDLQRRLRHILIRSRNARMLERIQALPADQRYFIAVGALHLPGETGVLASLKAAGYSVRRLY